MQKIVIYLFYFSIAVILAFNACKKERSCEGCLGNNKPPKADAGIDQVISIPIDSTLLDGSASSDPDGKIVTWQWKKIDGPAAFSFANDTASKTVVNKLDTGTYRFELTVKDNGGLSAKDTVQVMVGSPGMLNNRPPIAHASEDLCIILPTHSVTLDGRASTDPDENIVSYLWTKISGPGAYNFTNANAVQTTVNDLIEGVYLFELKVTDAGGLFSMDTTEVVVQVIFRCDGTGRPVVQVKLTPVGKLSIAKDGVAVAAVDNKIIFSRGLEIDAHSLNTHYSSSYFDILDIPSNSWTRGKLKNASGSRFAAVLGSKVYFPITRDFQSNKYFVDIYDASSGVWTEMVLPLPTNENRQSMLGCIAAGSKVLFISSNYVALPGNMVSFILVDILDVNTNLWQTDTLDQRPFSSPYTTFRGVTTTMIGSKIYIVGSAGGLRNWYGDPNISDIINIYDVSTGTWSASKMKLARRDLAAIAIGTKNYLAGGYIFCGRNSAPSLTSHVEIRDEQTGESEITCLFRPNAGLSAVRHENSVLFYNFYGELYNDNKFDIYNTITKKWSVGILPFNFIGASMINVNGQTYVAGGFVNGVLSDQVWKLEF